MNRDRMIEQLQAAEKPWDVVIIGGGATGLGCAVDAASRGYRTLLLERNDFGSGTSSRSTKLIHGGVRYLRRGNLFLVAEALRERGILMRNAPHLVSPIPFIIPAYRMWEKPYYGAGLLFYDALSGRNRIAATRFLSCEETIALAPTIAPSALRGSVLYHDAQFNDARLTIALARTAADAGAVVINYCRVTGILKRGSVTAGVHVEDVETGAQTEVGARCVINATGVFADDVRTLDDTTAQPMIRPSRGVHVVVDRRFLPGESAVLVPHTDDGRILFLIPWMGRVLIGTTDTPVETATADPVPSRDEIDYLIAHVRRYFIHAPEHSDILGAFAGLRPLIGSDSPGHDTAALSREHVITVSNSAMVTVTGGKWTTYRKMAEDAVDQAAFIAGLQTVPSATHKMRIRGYDPDPGRHGRLALYGSDAPRIVELESRGNSGSLSGSPAVPSEGEVRWFVESEMARSVEDVLSRRARTLFLDASGAVAATPGVARLMAELLGRDGDWVEDQVSAFTALANRCLPLVDRPPL
ncbi:MAG: glycerol-3-phosphate dehydrogenase/oxidase [Candidatus Krumholzibacteriota bacterium]|nr:glycerol-3-phosphate dehydrogenase/oxidase [Candidatus Krumholzibacteriota bacterium]